MSKNQVKYRSESIYIYISENIRYRGWLKLKKITARSPAINSTIYCDLCRALADPEATIQEFDGPFKNAFVNIISHICEQYPV